MTRILTILRRARDGAQNQVDFYRDIGDKDMLSYAIGRVHTLNEVIRLIEKRGRR